MSLSVEAVLAHASDLICVLEREGKVAFASPSVERLLGFHPTEVIGRNAFDYVHPDDLAVARRALRYAFRRSHQVLVLRLRTHRGAWLAVEALAGEPWSDGDGGGVPCLVVTVRDATARRRSEEELRRSEEKYRRLFEESLDAICIGTLDGGLLDVNPAAVELFEYGSKAEMLKVDVARDLYWEPEDRERRRARFLSRGVVDRGELELKTKYGRKITVQPTVTPIHDADGEIVGFRSILRDITEHRRLEEQLRQSQKMEAVGRLAGGVAHDFNNLLTAINGYSELLLVQLEKTDPLHATVEEILKAGRRAGDLTRRLLVLSRRQEIAPRLLNLNQVITEFEKLLRRVISEDVELRTRLAAEVWPIRGDLGQIEQIILNLTLNARDAMPNGGKLLISTAKVRLPDPSLPALLEVEPGNYVLLKVKDTGIGMPKEVRERAFEPFYSTKESGHNAGLGLAIVYGIVQQTGGYIDIDSVAGEGTTVRIYLPQAVGQEALEASVRDTDTLPRGDEMVLVVEDEDSVRSLVEQALELLGYRVLAAADAVEARRLWAELDEPPELLVTDVVMPGTDGPALASELVARRPGLRVLLMSGYVDDRGAAQELTERGASFLRKPFTPVKLALKVRATLDGPPVV